MGIFDSLGRGNGSGRGYGRDNKNQNGSRNPMQMLSTLKRDPLGTIQQAGFVIPKGMTNPQQIVQYLLQSDQIGNDDLQMIQNAVSNRRR